MLGQYLLVQIVLIGASTLAFFSAYVAFKNPRLWLAWRGKFNPDQEDYNTAEVGAWMSLVFGTISGVVSAILLFKFLRTLLVVGLNGWLKSK
jgi:hypothetical protein